MRAFARLVREKYYACKDNCGAPTVREDVLLKAVKDYLNELISEPMQIKIVHFLRSYKDHKKGCRKSFAAAIKKQIDQKRTEYNNLIRNLSTSAFAPDVVADISARMNEIKNEIETLENTEPPEEYTSDAIIKWLQAIREAPDKRAINLLIERIEVSTDKKTTDIKVTSTLTSVVNLVAAIRFERTTGRV